MQRRVTSHDVARLAGVSQSTVSLVLNGRTDIRIPESTRQRVFEAAQTLNYTRNASAHALLTGRTHRFGIVPIHPFAFTDHDTYYSNLTTSFILGAITHRYNLLLHCTEHAHWEALYRDIMGGSTDGVILIGRLPDDPLTHALIEARFPTVCVSYQPDLPNFHSVDCDNVQGGYLATQHLLSQGHRRIAYVFPHPESSWNRERYAGAQQAVTEAGLPSTTLLRLGTEVDELTNEMVLSLLKSHASDTNPPTALICNDDHQGTQLISLLTAEGIRIPQDIALVSYNSTDICERTHPTQTSVWQPLMEIGSAAVDMLMALFEGQEVPFGTRRFPMRLDVRESSLNAPGR